MSQNEISYEDTKQRMIVEIRKHQRGYLATSVGDSVTVRRMGLITDGSTIWCLTDVETRKYNQIKENPKVAIAAGHDLQLEGVASLKGHPYDEENAVMIKAYQVTQPELYERSSRPRRILHRPGTRVIEVVPTRIALNVWTPNFDLEPNFHPYMLILNTENGKAFKIVGTEGYKATVYKE